nr:hypothetical protein [Tanacetum cinerariifolium]
MRKKDAEREKAYEQMRKFMEGMNIGPVREANKGPIIVSQHYGISDFSDFPSNRGGRSSFQTQANNSYFNMGTPTNWQTPMPSQPGSSNWQSHMAAQSATPFMQPAISSHPDTYNYQSQIPSHVGIQIRKPLLKRIMMVPAYWTRIYRIEERGNNVPTHIDGLHTWNNLLLKFYPSNV